MSWYRVDREVETTMGQHCQREKCPNDAERTLRFAAYTPDGKEFIVGAYGLCDGCADDARRDRLIAFSSGIAGGYVR